MSSRQIAAVAALLTACAPAAAWAQQCPSNAPGAANAGAPPLPTVVSYAVTRTTGPANEREKEAHEATVTGGHATEGSVRIDMRLSTDVQSHCELPVAIFDPTVSSVARNRGDAGTVGRALMRDRFIPNGSYNTDGSNRLVVVMNTLATFGNPIDSFAFTIGSPDFNNPPPNYPFKITRRSIGDMALSLSATTGTADTDVTVIAMMPAGVARDAVVEPVIFTVEPPSAGRFSGSGSTVSSRREQPLNFGFSPSRAQVMFEPADVSSPVNATIIARVAGGTARTAFTVLPGPTTCVPVGEYKRVPDGVELTITNTGDRACPAYRAEMRKVQSSYFDAREIPALAPAPRLSGKVGAPVALRMATLRATTPATSATPASTSSWAGMFRLSDANLPVGTVVATRLIPQGAGGGVVELGTFTIPPMRGTTLPQN